MAKKTEKEQGLKVGDKIATKLNGEVIGAVVVAIDGDKITAVQAFGDDFTVDEYITVKH